MKQQAILSSIFKSSIHGGEHQGDDRNESESVLKKTKVDHEDDGPVHVNSSTLTDALWTIGFINGTTINRNINISK